MRLNFSYASRSNLFIYELYPLCIFLLDFWYFFLLNPKSSSHTRDITPLSVRRCKYFLPVCQLLLTLFVVMFPHWKGSFVPFLYSQIDYLFLFPLDFKSENLPATGSKWHSYGFNFYFWNPDLFVHSYVCCEAWI